MNDVDHLALTDKVHFERRTTTNWELALKGVGRIYQQTFIDIYAKVACATLFDRKTPITAAGLLNDRVIPFPLCINAFYLVNIVT